MKKTKTGLHIQTRKNRIEVYTQKELEQQEQQRKEARTFIIRTAIVLLIGLWFVLGFILGAAS
jgi:ABC-type transport system involved in cytochrome bd biosynthesis fused ATPase/permease subunit